MRAPHYEHNSRIEPRKCGKDRVRVQQFLEMNRDDALIVVGWLQGYYLDEHETPVVDFAKLSVDSVSLANRCKARPDENVMAAADRVFGK